MTTAHHGRADYRFVFSVPHLLFLSYYSAQSKHAKALILWNTYPVLIQWSPLVPIGPHTRKVLPVVTFITNGKGNSRFVYSSMCSIF